MSAEEIARIVEKHVTDRSLELGVYRFTVPAHLAYQDEEDLWHVCIEPDRNIEKRGQFYDILNSIEELIEKEHGLNVMIVPVKPESATSAP